MFMFVSSPRLILSSVFCAAVGVSLVTGCQTSSAANDTSSSETSETSADESLHAKYGAEEGGKEANGDDAGGAHEHGPGHFANPEKYVPAWNAPERDAYQMPAEILAAMNIKPGAVVVDLGAGTGYLTPKLSAAVGPEGKVIAADLEPAMLKFLDEAAKKEGWSNVSTHGTAVDDPKLDAESVDAIVALNVWHHIENRPAFAAKLKAALKPGGVFVVVDFLPQETEGFGPPLKMRLAADQVLADLNGGGLTASLFEETMPSHYVVIGAK